MGFNSGFKGLTKLHLVSSATFNLAVILLLAFEKSVRLEVQVRTYRLLLSSLCSVGHFCARFLKEFVDI